MQETLGGADLLHNSLNAEGVNTDQSDEDQQKVKKLLDQFFMWKRHRERYSKDWLKYYKFFRGSQWSSNRPSWRNSEVVNLIWTSIQSQAPLQTDVRPKFEFLPTEPSDLNFARILDKIADSDWEKYNWLRTVYEVILDGYLYGIGISSMKYDPSQDYGIGAAVYKSEDPFYCYPDPESNDINDSISRGFWHVRPIATSRLKEMFPKFSHLIKPDIVDNLEREKTNIKDSGESTYFHSDRDLPEYMEGVSENSSDIPKTLLFEAFLKPGDMEELEEDDGFDDEGEPKKKFTIKKKYPKGRYVVIANGLLIIDQDELPYEDNLIPYSKYNNYVLSREFFGVSEVEQLEPSQVVFNKILCFTLDSLALMGNPIWVTDDTNLDTDNLYNQPGMIVTKTKGSELRREMGVTVNPGMLQILDRLVTWFNDQAGQSEFSRGEAPGGVTAASAIEQLISASRTRIRQKQRNLDEYLKTVGRQYANRVFEFYDVPKIFRITNDDGSQSFIKMAINKTPMGERVANVSEFIETRDGLKEGKTESLIIKGSFDIRVKTGSDLPFEAADKERKALALFDRGIIDEEEVLDQMQMPNKEKILNRLRERQQMAAQQQQQQGAQ